VTIDRSEATSGYHPRPIDASGVSLPRELEELRERLAENVHEVWAAQRIADGWRYGPRRDDARKEHPGLAPYDRLSEAEKEYDRKTAFETLRTILALGFRIEPPGGSGGPQARPTEVRPS
jgi:hypothetical protein